MNHNEQESYELVLEISNEYFCSEADKDDDIFVPSKIFLILLW